MSDREIREDFRRNVLPFSIVSFLISELKVVSVCVDINLVIS